MNIRPARQGDLDALWNFLAMAAFEPDAAAARGIPIVAAHLLGWQRPTDFGVIAELDGDAVGAAWARQLGEQDNPFYVDDRTLEISVAVRPHARGRGIGTALVRALIDEAKSRELALCLNIREANPAFRLYERLGFRRVPGREVCNRTGTLSIGMVLDVVARSPPAPLRGEG
jgi:ribosomal protein S18 acetylase RimI-like enzyme